MVARVLLRNLCISSHNIGNPILVLTTILTCCVDVAINLHITISLSKDTGRTLRISDFCSFKFQGPIFGFLNAYIYRFSACGF